MKIGSIKENLSLEQRIAVTPEIIKKYKSLDLNIILPKGYGEHLGISDKEFSNEGAEMLGDDEKVLTTAILILKEVYRFMIFEKLICCSSAKNICLVIHFVFIVNLV